MFLSNFSEAQFYNDVLNFFQQKNTYKSSEMFSGNMEGLTTTNPNLTVLSPKTSNKQTNPYIMGWFETWRV